MSSSGGRSRRKTKALAHRYVDMWAFMGVHPTNMDFFKRLKRADDVQFGANMDVCGTVSEPDPVTERWAQSHILAMRTDCWNRNKDLQQRKLEEIQRDRQEVLRKQIKQSGPLSAVQTERWRKTLLKDPVMRLQASELESRRLVMKLFRSGAGVDRMRWLGSLEELVTSEVHNSLGAARPVISMAGFLDNHKYVAHVQENRRTFRIPSLYTFCYFHQRRERLWYVNIKRKWISIGADFVVESEGRKIGDIDGALFGFGYNAHVYVYEPDLAGDSQFLDLLTLFTASVSYHHAMRKAIRRRLAASRNGLAGDQIIEDEEFKLLKNPRAA